MNVNSLSFSKSIFNNQIIFAGLVFLYCMVFGVSSSFVLEGIKYLYFLGSFVFVLTLFYINDYSTRNSSIEKSLIYNQAVGNFLIIIYFLIYGITSFAILNGIQLAFFMLSYFYAVSLLYLSSSSRVVKQKIREEINRTVDSSISNVNQIDRQKLREVVDSLNKTLTPVIGFSELILNRNLTEAEKKFMMINVYENAIALSLEVKKISELSSDKNT